ncbi:MAG: IS21-like element helper ATPase IstB [Sphaerochaetaceae bacterium]|jgi:DNA replication protein DnaC
MAYLKSDEVEGFRRLARCIYLSKEVVEDFIDNATPGQMRAVTGLIEDELEVRERHKRERFMHKARFPVIKSFDGYDFSQVSFPEGYGAEDLVGLGFVERAQDFVFHGKTGRGKTHLAIAIGIACVQQAKQVRFFTAAELVMLLVRANHEQGVEALLNEIAKADVVIIDELGYVPLDIEGARLLFQVMSDCYEKRSLIITTNIEFSKWGTVFGDDKLAAALIDRIVHHGRLVEFNGTSRRMDAALMLGKTGE